MYSFEVLPRVVSALLSVTKEVRHSGRDRPFIGGDFVNQKILMPGEKGWVSYPYRWPTWRRCNKTKNKAIKMLTLLTALALNVPGNPSKFECQPVNLGRSRTTQCIKFENQSPKYRITFSCVGSDFSINNGTITVFPSAGTVVQSGYIFNCTINQVDIL